MQWRVLVVLVLVVSEGDTTVQLRGSLQTEDLTFSTTTYTTYNDPEMMIIAWWENYIGGFISILQSPHSLIKALTNVTEDNLSTEVLMFTYY